MKDKPASIEELSSEELAALIDLAEAYQAGGTSRRDVLKAAAAGGAAGLLGGAGYQAATQNGQSGTSDNGQPVVQNQRVTVAPPGKVQAAIDNAASNGGSIVRLDPTKRYVQPPSPWILKPDVILDFNGAFVYGAGDRSASDILHIHPGAQVHRPRIDLYDGGDGYTSSNGYSGRVFSLDTNFGKPYFADGTTIRGGTIRAVGGTGTACYLGVNTSGIDSAITHIDLELDIGIPRGSNAKSSIGTAVHLDTTGAEDSGYINGVRISGNWRYPNIGVLQTGVTGAYNQQVLNCFNVQLQASESANAFWYIKDPTWARLNIWWGFIWDAREYGDYGWKIDSKYQDPEDPWRGCERNAVNTPELAIKYVRNRSPNDHYINRTDKFETKVV